MHCFLNLRWLWHGYLLSWWIDRTVFVCESDRAMAIFDGMDDRLPLPGFAAGVGLMVGELFGWLVD